MISPAYAQRMARYNRWQNSSLYRAADTLSDAERTRQTGAFFGSIHGTLAHVLWADNAWMHRFVPGLPPPRAASGKDSPHAYPQWSELKADRIAFDQVLIDWADRLVASDLATDHTWYSGAAKRELTLPVGLLVTHMFNHQTHHRGQVHCMLTQAGAQPDDTDLFLMDL